MSQDVPSPSSPSCHRRGVLESPFIRCLIDGLTDSSIGSILGWQLSEGQHHQHPLKRIQRPTQNMGHTSESRVSLNLQKSTWNIIKSLNSLSHLFTGSVGSLPVFDEEETQFSHEWGGTTPNQNSDFGGILKIKHTQLSQIPALDRFHPPFFLGCSSPHPRYTVPPPFAAMMKTHGLEPCQFSPPKGSLCEIHILQSCSLRFPTEMG